MASTTGPRPPLIIKGPQSPGRRKFLLYPKHHAGPAAFLAVFRTNKVQYRKYRQRKVQTTTEKPSNHGISDGASSSSDHQRPSESRTKKVLVVSQASAPSSD
ncbi:hypothetical protein JCGZ_26553 [Jatropha curcas]|uniref:Uncharacterized protein n=1 Tax=Jatropha curcas TaxID=180498 RepID=A0A067JYG7_JATCU|nr:hypothetical protein JCGZ_26553 [Jatropha curcas]